MRRMIFLVVAIVAAAFLYQVGGRAFSAGDAKALSFDRQSLTARPDPLIVGVGVHFGIGGEYNYVVDKSAALLKELGVDSYRDDFPWGSFDHPSSKPGAYEPRKVFELMKVSTARPLLILGHPNALVPEGNPPLSAAGQAAFADFAGRAAAATHAFNPIYEVWNEWNMNAVGGLPWLIGAGDASDARAAVHYAGLARAAIPAIRKAEPTATILSGAVGVDQGWQWTKAIVDDGATDGATALSVHMYNHCEARTEDRTATEMIDRLATLQTMLKARTGGADAPVYVTEFGWPTALKPCVISRQTAADNIAQFLLWSASTPWMKGAWVYQLKDQGRDPNEMEFNFGLYDYDYNEKPAACAVREATRLIKSSKAFRLERPFPNTFVVQLSSDEGVRLVAWTTGDDKKTDLSLPKGTEFTAKPLCNPSSGDAKGAVSVGAEPVVITVSKADSLKIVAAQ